MLCRRCGGPKRYARARIFGGYPVSRSSYQASGLALTEAWERASRSSAPASSDANCVTRDKICHSLVRGTVYHETSKAARRLHLDAATSDCDVHGPRNDRSKEMLSIDSIKKDLIMCHPTFVCPISGEILDYKTSYLVRFKHRGIFKTDIISITGYNKLTEDQKTKLSISIIDNIEGL